MRILQYWPVVLSAVSAAAGECLLVPLVDQNASVGECLSEDAAIPYQIELNIAAEEGSQRFLGCQLQLELQGMLTKTNREPLTNPAGVVQAHKTLFNKSLGKVLGGSITVEGKACAHPWTCRTITVHDGHRYWTLDCEGVVAAQGDSINLSVSGIRRYKITVITDPVAENSAASKGTISIRLHGEDGSQSSELNLLTGSRTPGITYSAYYTAADVGKSIKEVNITNYTPNDPWKFKSILITTDEGQAAKFSGGQFVGTPFAKSLMFRNSFYSAAGSEDEGDFSAGDSVPIYVECHTRLVDIISGTANRPFTMNVDCPPGCDVNPISYVVGLSLHPGVSSICGSAVADGAISTSGGRVQLQLYPSDARDLSSLYRNVSHILVHPYRDDATTETNNVFYTTTRVSSLDDLDSYLRIVDIFGHLSHTGRLEMRQKNGVWGSVCSRGDTEQFSPEAAKIACQEMGFLWGSVLSASCDSMNLCAPLSLPVAAGGITCKGNEDKFGDCAVQSPDPVCNDHTHDVLIHCSDTPPQLTPPAGTIRIVDAGGSPAVRGFGRLEIFIGHEWSTVCNDQWTRANAGVACREMGYTSMKDVESLLAADKTNVVIDPADNMCENLMGTNYCGKPTQKIGITDVVCDGTEQRLRDCSMSAPDDVYCVHSEDVVLGCDGPGDPSGVGLYAAEHVPHLRYIPLKATHELRCTDTFSSAFSKKEPLPGELFIVRCQANCQKLGKGSVVGTYVYTWESNVCLAAIHSGIIDDSGMTVGVSAGHGQHKFYPSSRHGVQSDEGGEANESFYFVRMTEDLTARMPVLASELSKVSEGGFSLLPESFMMDRENYRRSFSLEELAGPPLSFLQIPVTTPVPLVAFCNEGNHFVKFDGTTRGQVVLNQLPGGSSLSSLNTFTFIVRFRASSGANSGWRSLLSYGECEGFNLVIDPSGQILFEQLCTPLVVETKIQITPGTWQTVSVAYDHLRRTLSVFKENEEVLADEVINQPLRWNAVVRLGRSSTLEYEPFLGEISHALLYSYSLKKEGSLALAVKRLSDTCTRLSPPESAPSYSSTDYRMCMSDCTGNKGSMTKVKKQMSRIQLAKAPAIPIDCKSTLDNMVNLNADLDAEIEVICPLDCFDEHDQLAFTASKLDVFPGSFPICKAAHVQGFIPSTKNQRLQVKILPGRLTYLPAKGAPEDLSPELIRAFGNHRDLRSFTVVALTEPRTIPCGASAEFLAFSDAADGTHLLRCPAGCSGTGARADDTKRYVKQVHAAEPARGLLRIRDVSTPICRAAIDLGLATPTMATDVLVHLMQPSSSKTVNNERTAADVLDDIMMAYQLPFAANLPETDRLDEENDAAVFGSFIDTANEPIRSDKPGFELQPITLSAHCSDVNNITVTSDTDWLDLADIYYCNNGASLSGTLDQTPASVRVPELGISVVFQEDRCAIKKSAVDEFTSRHQNAAAPRHFEIGISSGDYRRVTSWMEVGSSRLECENQLSDSSALADDGEAYRFVLQGSGFNWLKIRS